MRNRKTLREKIEGRIARKRDDVFLPREFGDLGGEDQVLRAFRNMVRDRKLVRLGAARQALNKLGVKWEPTGAERAYNEGRSTQVPVNPAVRVKGRFSRKLRYQDTELVVER
jgi:hypothetical protein